MTRLMIPGPTEVSEKARAVMAKAITPHYGPEWCKLYFGIIDKLKKVFQTENDMYVYSATSSAAMEAAVAHAVEPGEEILICINGVFGERFLEMANFNACKPIIIRSEFGYPITVKQVRDALDENPGIRALAIVHNESSTGVVSDLTEIMKVAHERDVLTIVDTVSSMGGVDIKTDELGIDFCISGSQKCIGAPTGLGFLSVSKSAWNRIKARKEPVHSWYLNLELLQRYREKSAAWHPQGPNSAPVSLFLSLDQALNEIMEEGLANRFSRHLRTCRALRASIRAMGLKLYVEDDGYASKTLTAICLPDGIKEQPLREYILNKHNILVARGVGKTADYMIRIAHMSMTASEKYLIPTIEAVEDGFDNLGIKVNRGVAVDAFISAYRAFKE